MTTVYPPAPANRQGWAVAIAPLLLLMGLLLWEVPAAHSRPLHQPRTAAQRQTDEQATKEERQVDPRHVKAATVAGLLHLLGEDRLLAMARGLQEDAPPLASVPPQGPTPLPSNGPSTTSGPYSYSGAREPLALDGEVSAVLCPGVVVPPSRPYTLSLWVMPWWHTPPSPSTPTHTQDTQQQQEEDTGAAHGGGREQGQEEQESSSSPFPLLQSFREPALPLPQGEGVGGVDHLPSLFLLPPLTPSQGPRVLFSCVSMGGGMLRGLSSLNGLEEGVWAHVAMTWDNHTLRAYVDGILQGEMCVGYGASSKSSKAKYESPLLMVLGADPRAHIAATPGAGVGVGEGLGMRLPLSSDMNTNKKNRANHRQGPAVVQHVTLLTGTALTQEEVVRLGLSHKPWPIPQWVTNTWTHTQHTHGGAVSNALLPQCLTHLSSSSLSSSSSMQEEEVYWCVLASCLWAPPQSPTQVLLHKTQASVPPPPAPLGSCAYELLCGGVGVLPRLVLASLHSHPQPQHARAWLASLLHSTHSTAQQQALRAGLLSPPSSLPPLPPPSLFEGEGSCSGCEAVLAVLVPLARWAAARYGDILTPTLQPTQGQQSSSMREEESDANASPWSVKEREREGPTSGGVVIRPLQASDLQPPPHTTTQGLRGLFGGEGAGGGGAEVGWDRMRAMQGDTQAMIRLGRGLYWGTGGPLERQQAQDLFNQAAAQGDVEGLLNGGLLLSQSTDPSDRDKGREWVQQAAHKGSVGAYAVLGSWALAAGDINTALTCLRESVRLEEESMLSLSPWQSSTSPSTGEAHSLLALLEGTHSHPQTKTSEGQSNEDEGGLLRRRLLLVEAASRGHIQARLTLGLSLWNPAASLRPANHTHPHQDNGDNREWVVRAGPLVDALDVVLPPLYPSMTNTKEEKMRRCEAAVSLLRPVAHMALAGLWSSPEACGDSEHASFLQALRHYTLGPSPLTKSQGESRRMRGVEALLEAWLGQDKDKDKEEEAGWGLEGLEVVYGAMRGEASAQTTLGMALGRHTGKGTHTQRQTHTQTQAMAMGGLSLLHAAGVQGNESRALFELGEWCRGQPQPLVSLSCGQRGISPCLYYYRLSYVHAGEGPVSVPPLLRLSCLALWHTLTREGEGAWGVMMLVMLLVLLARRTARQHYTTTSHRDTTTRPHHD